MEVVCLDLEGVLVPEIWINFAKKTGIKALEATTRDIPDYDVLMTQRLNILKEHGLGLNDIQEVIAEMGPFPGAKEFVEWLRTHFQLIILSDTFYFIAAGVNTTTLISKFASQKQMPFNNWSMKKVYSAFIKMIIKSVVVSVKFSLYVKNWRL